MTKLLHGRAGHYPLLIAAGWALFFTNLGGPSLWDIDEGRNATCSFEMMEAERWVVPTFNADLRVDKPPFLYWCQIAAYMVLGVNEFAARLPSALAALAAMLLCYELARSMFRPSTGLIAGLAAGSTPLLCGAGRFANPDALLNLFTVLTLFLFWTGRDNPRNPFYFRVGVAAGLAVLAKGPVGLLMPGLLILVFIVWERRWDIVFNWGVLTGIAVCLGVALPWYVWVGIDTRGEFLRGFFLRHNVGRFLDPLEDHSGPHVYYLVVLLVGTAPWSLLFALTAWYAALSACRQPWRFFKRSWDASADTGTLRQTFGYGYGAAPNGVSSNGALANGGSANGTTANGLAPSSQENRHAAAYRFLWSWVLCYLIFFTVAATKLPNYVLPVVVPWAIFTARMLDRWRLGLLAWPRWAMPVYLGELFVLGIGLGAAFFVLSGKIPDFAIDARTFPGLEKWALAGLIPIGAGVVAWICLRRLRRTAATGAFLASGVALIATVFGGACAELNNVKAIRPLVAASGALNRTEDIRVGTLDVGHLPSLNFYVQRDVAHYTTPEAALAFLRYQTPVFLFLPAAAWQELAAAAPPATRLVARHADMYRHGEIVVVSNR